MRSKLLSIAIPTLNRADILKFTIENFIDQIAINSEKVELVVCSNACNDNTSDVMKEFVLQYDFIRYKECDNRVSLGDSFKRTVDFSKGKYFILWGDDDIPAPFLVSYLVHRIESNPDIELYYFNREKPEHHFHLQGGSQRQRPNGDCFLRQVRAMFQQRISAYTHRRRRNTLLGAEDNAVAE